MRERGGRKLLKPSKQEMMGALVQGWQGGWKELNGSDRLLADKGVRTL